MSLLKQETSPISKILYIFLWVHSLLIGMFIFFLPVFLWEWSLSLSHISLFISLTALSFIFWLAIWDRLRFTGSLRYIITISFIFEILLVSLWFFEGSTWYIYTAAFMYGIYNCFFWVTQRLMFLENTPPKSVGKQYGTIQILAFILVKIGIVTWAFILETSSFYWLWISVTSLSLICLLYFCFQNNLSQYFQAPIKKPITTFRDLYSFTDNQRSKFTFFLDGPFLFFESFFWVISLFLLANQSYSNLGIITVILAVSFAGIFWLMRQYIDSMNVRYVYYISCSLYAFSWILRGYVPEIWNIVVLWITVFIIAFCTSIFRLSFNKQFFDLAKNIPENRYIVIKSYYSQISIFIVFWLLSLIFAWNIDSEKGLWYLYYSLWVISLLYLAYKPHTISS